MFFYRLQAGSPPALPIFKGGWLDCWSYLAETNQLTRGLYPMLRYKKISSSKPTVITDSSKTVNSITDEPKVVNDELPESETNIAFLENDVGENYTGNNDDSDDDDYFDTEEIKSGETGEDTEVNE